jgi:hypothetical protein
MDDKWVVGCIPKVLVAAPGDPEALMVLAKLWWVGRSKMLKHGSIRTITTSAVSNVSTVRARPVRNISTVRTS